MTKIADNAKVTYTITRRSPEGLETTITRTGFVRLISMGEPPRPGMVRVQHKAGNSIWIDEDKLTIA